MRLRFILLFLVLVTARPAAAHPLPDVRFDRTAAVRLAPDGVEVKYTLEVSPLGLQFDAAERLTPAEIAKLDRTSAGLARVYARKVAAELLDRFAVTVDGARLPLTVVAIDVEMTDHPICRYRLRGDWPAGGRTRKLVVNDNTFRNRPGILNLTLDAKGVTGDRVEVLDSEEPPAKVRSRVLAQLTEAEAALARTATAEIRLPAAIAPTAVESDTGRSDSSANAATPAMSAVPEPVVTAESRGLAADLVRRGLPALFDSTLGLGVLLVAAFLFGAAHAFTPGHGKTLVAAYLIGERGTVRHAVLLGLVTTLTHTGSVIAVAAVLWGMYGNEVPGRTQGGLQLVAGILVVGVGLWLLLRRITGQSDHFHLFGGHHHHGPGGHSHAHSHSHSHDHEHAHSHPHEHAHPHTHDHSHNAAHAEPAHSHSHGPAPTRAKSTAGWLRIVLMGMGGGIVPCWDAVLLLVAAAALNRLDFAIPLLLAFSAGLGTVLVGLGIGVVYAYRAGSARFRDQRWFQFLPTASAVFLIAVGIWLCKSAVS